MSPNSNQELINALASLAGAAMTANVCTKRNSCLPSRAEELLALALIGFGVSYAVGGQETSMHFLRGVLAVVRPAAASLSAL